MHTIADAKDRLSELIDLALSGAGVIVTRHGHPVAEIRPLRSPGRPVTASDVDWLASHRSPTVPSLVDAGTFVSQMRDDDERL